MNSEVGRHLNLTTFDSSTRPPLTRIARFAVAASLVTGVALSAVWPSREGQFLSGDDERLILNHYLVNHPSFGNAITFVTHLTDDLYQPLPMMTFQIDYARGDPDAAAHFPVESAPFHRTNMWLHAINAVLVFVLVRRIVGCSRIGLLSALLFACHPFAVESVAWINGRMILMASVFALLAFLAAVNPKNSGPIMATIAFLFSSLCKILPTIPIVAAWYDRRVNGPWIRRRVFAFAAMLVIAMGFSALASYSVSKSVPAETIAAEGGAPAPARMILAASYYLENYFYPARLAAWSPPARVFDWTSPIMLRGLAECLAFVAAIFLARRRWPAVYVGLGTFALLLVPFLIAGTTRRFLAADRYMYLPIFGLHLAVAACAIAAFDQIRVKFGQPLARAAIGAPILAILAACIWWSGRLSETWRDSVQRDQRIVDVYPDEPDARTQLAKAEIFCGNPDAALNVIAEARRRWPDNARLYAVAGDAFRAKKDWPAAERELRVAAEKLPKHLRTQYEYALTLEAMGHPAADRYERILQVDPNYLPAITALARIHQTEGRSSEAAVYCEQALAINPTNLESLRRLAGIRMTQSEDGKALDLLERAARIDPADFTSMVWLQVLLTEAGRGGEMVSWWERAAAAGLDTPESQSWLAWAWFSADRKAEAEHLIARVTNQYPDRGRLILENSPRPALTDPTFFIMWARAVESLRRGDDGSIAELDGQAFFDAYFHSLQTERRRLIIAAIGHLTDDKRTMPAALYLVSRAFLIDGQVEAARKIAQRIVGNKSIWATAAKKLLTSATTSSPAKP